MAIARPQVAPTGGSAGLKIAAIAFAVVAVASITFTVIFFTQKADLIAAAERESQRAGRAENDARAAKQAFQDLASKVVEEPTEDPARVDETLARTRTRVRDLGLPESQLGVDAQMVRLVEQLVSLLEARMDEVAQLQQDQADLTQQLNDAVALNEKRAKEFDARIEELQNQYEQVRQDAETFRAEANEKITGMQRQRDAELAGIAAERDEQRQLREQADAALVSERDRSEKLGAQLAEYKGTGEGASVLQIKDGDIVRVGADNQVVYINLGQRDGVRAGMTFAVYSPIRGIPTDGKGKASIEVTDVSEATSECRVTTRAPGDPVLRGDIVANPVFDRQQRYNFAVVGDFDLNFDGNIDDSGGKEVARLIRRWGGTVVDQVDTRTDFLVLGAAPPKPLPAASGEEEAAAAERAAELARQTEAFEAARKEAVSLSIPILTRTQFLHFLGYGVPQNVPNDTPAM